jgi:hypothetical protein
MSSPVTGALGRQVFAFSEDVLDVGPGIGRKQPFDGFLVSQLQGPFDDIAFVFLKIEAVDAGVPKQLSGDADGFHCDVIIA